MKFTLVLISTLLCIIKSIKFEKSKTLANPFVQDYLPQVKFTPGNQIVDLTLVSSIHSTLLYETWEVLKQEKIGKKPLIAHIFKYTLGSNFPLKSDDLNYFCEKITSYNQLMKSKSANMRAIPCYNSTVYSQKIPGGVLSYLLFEKPLGGYKLPDMCTPNCSKERICRYMLKDFIKGVVESTKYVEESVDPLDVNFVLAQNGFFFGTVPAIKKGLNMTKASISNILAKEKNDQEAEESSPETGRHFVTLAYPKAYSPESVLSGGAQNTTDKIKEIKSKQFMVYLGKFVIDMYKGLDNSTNTPVPSPEDNFNPNSIKFKNLTDVFLNLNTEKNGNFSKFTADEYFGVTKPYVAAAKEFVQKRLTSQKAFKDMDQMLVNSFYEWIFKSVMFDVDNKIQFDKYDSMLAHKFLQTKLAVNQVKSDTGFDK